MGRFVRCALALVIITACAFLASCSTHQAKRSAPPPPPPPLPGYVAGLGSKWSVRFNAEFTGSSSDAPVWSTCYPWGSPAGCTNFGNRDEYEWYLPSQVRVSGGALRLEARRVRTPGRARDGRVRMYGYRSGMVTTYPRFRFQYGYVQVVARVPYGPGLWPALWLAAADQAWPPEIDILEHYGTQAQYTQHLHASDMSVLMGAESAVDLGAGWHAFGLYWSPSRVVWYVDGRPVLSAGRGVPRQAMYFIANLAVYQQNVTGWRDAALDLRSVAVWQARTYRG